MGSPAQDDSLPLKPTQTPAGQVAQDVAWPALACASPATPTPSMTEGPYYKEGSPARASLLEENTPGRRILLSGYVLTTGCQPIANAWLDFWQTDGNGEYDNAGYRMRGHLFTDETGRYTLETVVPGLYPGRTAHIHVKVQAPGGPALTTQIYFPGVSENATDAIFSEHLLAVVQESPEGMLANFNFVLETALTQTPSPIPTLHPMNILAQRQTPYPGSPIVIEEELAPGANYNRYIASYRSEGLKIYALLTIPGGEMPPSGWPALVFNHGYIPPDQYRTTDRYVAYVDTLARHGYIVFRIDYRGHDRSEGVAAGAYGNPGYTVDVLNAVGALKSFPQADPQRIGMWGHSMGGYLTLRAMVISPDIKAGVIWAGVVASYPDLLTRWRRDSGQSPTPNPPGGRRWRTDWIERYGSPEENPDFWNGISANSYLNDLSGPIQLHHGAADESVPLEFSKTLYQQLLAAGKTAELYTYAGDNHNLSNNFRSAMIRTVEFFDRYLK